MISPLPLWLNLLCLPQRSLGNGGSRVPRAPFFLFLLPSYFLLLTFRDPRRDVRQRTIHGDSARHAYSSGPANLLPSTFNHQLSTSVNHAR
jgi:hypothetical protein